jgi:SAM-dependent methyltransferase
MDKKHPDEIRTVVRKKYGEVAKSDSTGCCTPVSSCCGEPNTPLDDLGALTGYSQEELNVAPEGSNMGLGCGNPQAIAALKPGETVLDLGSGGGFDCFLAARQVGETGHVIGVDMTADMIAKARENALKGDYSNVEFRLGEIEHLPVADASVDDVVATAPLPPELKNDLDLLSACVSGAATVVEITAMLQEIGFQDIQIQTRDESRELIREWVPGKNIQDYIVSASIEAVKP